MDWLSTISKFDEYESKANWNEVFHNINIKSDEQEETLELTTDVATEDHNIDLNRYSNVLPFDQHRVKIKPNTKNDYINASLLNLPFANRRYILTQGPLSETANHFWQMIWEQKSPIIVMLNKLIEHSGNIPIRKCHAYFPTNVLDSYPVPIGEKLTFESFSCELISEEESENFIIRKIKLTELNSNDIDGGKESRVITHFQFTRWPDFGVPESTSHFLSFLLKVSTAIDLLPPDTGIAPITIHCSAGIGRSGTFILVDVVLEYFKLKESGKAYEELPTNSIEELVVFLRRYRMGLIQTPDQLQFSWHAIVDFLRQNLEDSNAQTIETSKSLIESSGRKRLKTTDSEDVKKRKEKVQEMKEKMKLYNEHRHKRFYLFRIIPEQYNLSIIAFITGISMAISGYFVYKFYLNS